jgi:hypothetical protein
MSRAWRLLPAVLALCAVAHAQATPPSPGHARPPLPGIASGSGSGGGELPKTGPAPKPSKPKGGYHPQKTVPAGPWPGAVGHKPGSGTGGGGTGGGGTGGGGGPPTGGAPTGEQPSAGARLVLVLRGGEPGETRTLVVVLDDAGRVLAAGLGAAVTPR